MAAIDTQPACASPAERVLAQIEKCLQPSCVICIEHTPSIAPSWSPWQTWGKPRYHSGSVDRIHAEIDHCRAEHADHFIRLNIEDPSCHCRCTFIVHTPMAPILCRNAAAAPGPAPSGPCRDPA